MRVIERSPCGTGACMTCPFAYNDESEMVQNYGCLPTPYDILNMKEESGHNWSCHSDDTAICAGFVRHLKEYRPDLDYRTGNLISYDTWYQEGEEIALLEADNK